MSNDDVRQELTAIVQSLRRQHDPAEANVTAVVTRFADVLLGRLGSRLWTALSLAAAVFLFACANVAGVRTAQLRERTTELATRLFLGASRPRLAAQLALESIPLALAALAMATILWFGLVALLSSSSTVLESGVALGEHRTGALLMMAGLTLCGWYALGRSPPASCLAATSLRRIWRPAGW